MRLVSNNYLSNGELMQDSEIQRLKAENQHLRERLMFDGGEPSVKSCYEYSDKLVKHGVAYFGNLTRLEWMVRVLTGYSRRQDEYIKKLEARLRRLGVEQRIQWLRKW